MKEGQSTLPHLAEREQVTDRAARRLGHSCHLSNVQNGLIPLATRFARAHLLFLGLHEAYHSKRVREFLRSPEFAPHRRSWLIRRDLLPTYNLFLSGYS